MMIKNSLIVVMLGLLLVLSLGIARNDHGYQSAMHQALDLISHNHAYLSEKRIDWSCIESTYLEQAKQAQNDHEILKVFENLMLEFTDNHMILNTNDSESYRLFSPVKVIKQGNGFMVDDIWKSKLSVTTPVQIGDQFIDLNGQTSQQIIDDFPTQCVDKNRVETQQWMINKALAGVYSKPRLLRLKNPKKVYAVNLDTLIYKTSDNLLDFTVQDNLAIITINDSLGNTNLIKEFDETLNQLSTTDGLILDLRNTISGGDSYMARAIMGRLVDKIQAYQKHQYLEKQEGAVGVNRIWVEYVEPRGSHYDKPLVVLSNYWTGGFYPNSTDDLEKGFC
ncbi:MAG: S41 family peptidase [Marinicella sp.]